MERARVAVAVVGAGVAGLAAARGIKAAGQTFIVLEARDRVGGRLRSELLDGGHLVEVGGQWISPDQDRVHALIHELGLETYPRYRSGVNIYIGSDGSPRRYTGDILPLDMPTRAELERITSILDELAAGVDANAPWTHPRANEYDTITFEQWLRQQTDDPEAIANLALFVAAAMITKPASTFSLLQALVMSASAGGFTALADPDIVLDRRVRGGLHQVAEGLADMIGREAIRLNTDVQAVYAAEDGLQLTSHDLCVTATDVIIAVPPHLVQRIDFDPSLPPLKQQMLQHQSTGQVIKVQAYYSEPFWRRNRLSGTGFSPYQIVHEIYDNTTADGAAGTLVGFISDLAADRLLRLDAASRREAILRSFATYVGDQALDPFLYYESDWNAERYTQGAYGTSFDLGGITRYAELVRSSTGHVHFACADIAGTSYIHVDGAIRMGERAAREIVAPGSASKS